MSSIIVDCTSAQDILTQLNAFLTVGHTMPGVYSGTGNGWIDDAIGTAVSIYEIITVTFSSATNFTVSGSISGGLGAGTVGTLFTSTVIRFTATASTTPWASGDTVRFQMTAPWQAKIIAPGSQYLWVAPGNDNNSVIRVGLTTSSDSTGGYFNARTWMFPYWSDATYAINNAWTAQYKYQPGPYWPLGSGSVQTCRLIARADGNFCYAVAVIGTTMSAMSMGFFDCFHTRDYYQFPCLIGGSMDWDSSSVPGSTSTSWKWSDGNLRYPLYGADNFVTSNNPANELALHSGVNSNDFYYRTFTRICNPVNSSQPMVWSTGQNAFYACFSSTFGAGYAGAYQRCNLDGSITLWPTLIYSGRRADGTPYFVTGAIGKYPFVGRIPAYNAAGSIIVKQQIFRDAVTRRRIIAITGGALEDASNFYGLELA
jgi:hypothetical protein